MPSFSLSIPLLSITSIWFDGFKWPESADRPLRATWNVPATAAIRSASRIRASTASSGGWSVAPTATATAVIGGRLVLRSYARIPLESLEAILAHVPGPTAVIGLTACVPVLFDESIGCVPDVDYCLISAGGTKYVETLAWYQ